MASATLEEKINKIRQQNEEIRRRHEEVEADKQNAAKLNALVKMVPPTDWPERKEPPEFSNPPPPRSNGNSKPKNSVREYRGQRQQYHTGGGDGKKTHVFADGDGPPPDPSYNFLADSERDERTREDSRDNERFRGRGGPLRGGSKRRGGGREGHSKEYRGAGPAPKDATKPEYEAWRAERNRIDEARISRQRTAEGNWRREWDNNKLNVEEDETGTPKVTRLDLGDIPRKEHKDFDKWQSDGNDYDSPRGRGGKQYISRGAPRGSHNRVYQHSNSFEQFHGPVSPPATKTPLSPNGIDDRMVLATDKSLKVIVNHGATVPKGPVMSVKVSPASIAGTGRVGPRQKPRVLYSSQSEAEVGLEPETLSRHKSPEDKTNRVSFNRDVGEQQRYVPKSPHPQRKGESNSKSPFLGRKEYKYDSQQQRHGENEPKSPYLQRREFKDPPKSPHFQKKFDFTNRDSHKQRNGSSVNDTFKSNNPQKRTSERTKTDTQKFVVPRKTEDPLAPKPQRINKRNDKSKGFYSKSKEARESSANENDLGAEESTKNIVNGNKNHDDAKKDDSGDSVAVEITKDQQNKDKGIPEGDMSSETLSPSIGVEEDSQSTSDGTKLVDNSEAVILIGADGNEGSKPENISQNEVMDEIKLNLENIETNNATESTNENAKDVESEKKVDKISDSVKNETEKATVHENEKEVSKETEGVKNIQVTYDNVSKDAENCANAANIDTVEKLEEKIVQDKLEINETKNEVSLEPEKSVDVVLQAQDTGDLKKAGEKKTETVDHEVKIDETKDEVSLKPEEIPKEITTPQDIVSLEKLDENEVESVEIESKIKETKAELSLKPEETVNEIPTDQETVDIEKFEEKITTAENELQIDEKIDGITPKLEDIANESPRDNEIVKSTVGGSFDEQDTLQISKEQVPNNDVNKVVKDSEDKGSSVI